MAKQTKSLAVRVNDKEQIWGIIYLLFCIFLLPALLSELNGLLAIPLSNAWYNFLYFSLNFLFIIWIFHNFFKRSLIHVGHHFGEFLLSVLGGSAVYWLCSWGISALIRLLFPDFVNLNDIYIVGMAHNNFFIMLLGTIVLVPVAEEALYRGLIFGSLYPKSHWAAYFLSTILFAVVHTINYWGVYELPNLLVAFLQYIPAGLVLAWAYRYSGSIFAPILIHASINAIGFLSISVTIG